MPEPVERPVVLSGGLVTVAFLKARLDEGSDHLGIFMPLVLDSLSRLRAQSFTADEVQELIATTHGVAMPRPVVTTLLKRAIADKYVSRQSGRYRTEKLPQLHVAEEKSHIEEGQRRLAQALKTHAEHRQMPVESTDVALEMLFRFLEAEQVGLLLGNRIEFGDAEDASLRERVIVAEFLQDVASRDSELVPVLRGMLEGLVLYHAAFLPDLSTASRRFKNLRVVFDSSLIRQILGYEGAAMKTLMRETVSVFNATGVQCLVFDKTIHEIQRILATYEKLLGTAQGRASFRPGPMARYFLTQRYTPSDVREMSALLERDIVAAGFQIQKLPSHVKEYTAGEHALAMRLAHPNTKDELEPRVVHDVDCVAGILTLRRGFRSTNIEDAQAVFATASPLVLRNTRLWWEEDEREIGVGPVVPIRALVNLAWLKKPSLCSDFKIRELVALCTAALRPTQRTWERFLRHLESLRKSQKITSDEVTAILVSAMSDQLLSDAEFENDDPNDLDAVTLDEIVDRVSTSYAAEAKEQVNKITNQYEAKLAELSAEATKANERAAEVELAAENEATLRTLAISDRAGRWARWITQLVRWTAFVLVLAGAIALIIGHPVHGGWIGVLIAIVVLVFVALETLGILKHVSELLVQTEENLTRRFCRWMGEQI